MDEALERRIREASTSNDPARAVTLALEGYGPEIMGLLVATLRSEDEAAEVFARFAEELWAGFGTFRWECACRTWMYLLARGAKARYLRDPALRRPRAATGELARVVEKVRSETAPWLRTTAKNQMAELRRQLEQDDQDLLILRVDRGMAWDDVATVMFGEAPDAATRKRHAARLRKRFQSVTTKLRELAEEAGLLSADGE